MKKQIHSEILIHCSPKKVWDLLIDFENYPIWNPFIRSIEGNLKLGFKGIFDGLHKFEIVDLGAGKVLFKHSENEDLLEEI